MLNQPRCLLAVMYISGMHYHTPDQTQCINNQMPFDGYLMGSAVDVFVAVNAFVFAYKSNRYKSNRLNRLAINAQ